MDLAAIIAALAKLAWPVAVIAGIAAFKLHIWQGAIFLSKRFQNAKFDAFGFKAELSLAEEQQKAASKPEDKTTTVSIPTTPAIAKIEAVVREEIKNQSNQIDYLVRQVAISRLISSFSLAYGGMFGSQLGLMKELKARRKIEINEVYKMFVPFEEKFSDFYKNYGFSGWINYLKSQSLVAQVDQEQGAIKITDIGDDFMLWLEYSKFTIDKPW